MTTEHGLPGISLVCTSCPVSLPESTLVVQSLSRVQRSVTPWTAARRAPLPLTRKVPWWVVNASIVSSYSDSDRKCRPPRASANPIIPALDDSEP